MKKTLFVCPKDGTIDIAKVTSKDSIVRDKKCPICKGKMNFIRQNKKKYKIIKKKNEREKKIKEKSLLR